MKHMVARGHLGWGRGLLLVFVVGIGVAGIIGLHRHGVHLRDLTPFRIREFILSYGWWAPVVYLSVYGQPVIPLPASIMIMAAGLAFGPIAGSLLAIAGSMVRALIQFGLVRVLGRDTVRHVLKGRLATLEAAVGRHGFQTVLAIRLIPTGMPFDLQNVALGLSPVSLTAYTIATLVAMIPATIVFVIVGHSVTDLHQWWKVVLAIVAVAGLGMCQRWFASRRRPPKS